MAGFKETREILDSFAMQVKKAFLSLETRIAELIGLYDIT
jgi:hypothetical protein